jgi:ABC-type microcin C transport system permease subunit YejB
MDQRFDSLQNTLSSFQNTMIIALAGLVAAFGGAFFAAHL